MADPTERLARIETRLDGIDKKSDEILTEVKATNGRVRVLEEWRAEHTEAARGLSDHSERIAVLEKWKAGCDGGRASAVAWLKTLLEIAALAAAIAALLIRHQ